MKFTVFSFILSVLLTCTAIAHEGNKVLTAPVAADGVQRVLIIGGSYFFEPDHLTVKVNVPVELSVKREPGLEPHTMVMDDPEAGMAFAVPLGTAPQVVKFTPTKTGVFHFYCIKRLPLLGTHRARGMDGVLEVVP